MIEENDAIAKKMKKMKNKMAPKKDYDLDWDDYYDHDVLNQVKEYISLEVCAHNSAIFCTIPICLKPLIFVALLRPIMLHVKVNSTQNNEIN